MDVIAGLRNIAMLLEAAETNVCPMEGLDVLGNVALQVEAMRLEAKICARDGRDGIRNGPRASPWCLRP